jgi:hypothetical protein
MHTATPHSTPAPISETGTTSRLVTVKTLATHEPDACPEGGTRYILFHAGDDLEAAGIVIRVGRKILIDMPRYIDWLRSGGARDICGRASSRTRLLRTRRTV